MYRLNDKIKDLKPYDPVETRYRVHLDANESFLSLPAGILEEAKRELGEIAFNRYPDPAAKELCGAFAAHYGVEAEHVVAGNGSDELISVIFGAFLQKGEAFATVEPDFSMYAFNGALNEARHATIGKQADFTLDIDKIIETCHNEKVKLLIFSNPCNPTSLVSSKEEMRRLVRSVDALVVLDEAYMDFSSQSLMGEEDAFDNLILLRTCSKAFGMAALRLGFAVARKELADALRAVKSPYNVNTVSQTLGTIVLRHGDALEEARRELLASRDELYAGLEAAARRFPGRFRLLPGETNFAALLLPDGEQLYQFLGERGIAVRYTGGLVRVTCGRPPENELFLEELTAYLQN